jgi:hypothetical protein
LFYPAIFIMGRNAFCMQAEAGSAVHLNYRHRRHCRHSAKALNSLRAASKKRALYLSYVLNAQTEIKE